MHYEEENHKNHQERWHQGSRNRRPRPEAQEHFNDFSSRWNEPVPPLFSSRQEEINERRRFRNDDWNGNQQRQHPDQQRDEYEQWYQSRYRNQQDPRQQRRPQHEEGNYNRSNQYANDRWRQDDFIMHEEELRRRYNRQFREEEDRRRRRR